ncbi:MAG: asparagine synthase (glutamine-hydrolyzing) [Pseudomonadota bacterium]
MCGICGKFTWGRESIKPEEIDRMRQTMAYRGPDDQGVYTDRIFIPESENALNIGLGHNRLSIIDLSLSGRQPMTNEDGTVWITFNGEIYNFKEIRARLLRNGHQFRSDTDTEVIIHLYEEKGLEAVEDLKGMFAFCIWDSKRKRIWLCRDRLGIKPLVYFWNGRQLSFASEIKALISDTMIPKEIDFEAIQLYMAFSYIPAPRTIFKSIRKLEPGCGILIENGIFEQKKYWDIGTGSDAEDKNTISMGEWQARLKTVLSDAVRIRMIADVPLGAFLSGGIDSSIIVGLMAGHSDKRVKTFSIGFKDDPLYDETRYAREVAVRFNTEHHEFKLEQRDMLEALPEVLSMFDEPFSDSSAIPTYIVSRETRKHVTVALSGDGGDELFAGYRSYLGPYWFSTYMKLPAILREHFIERLVMRLPDSRDNRIMEYSRRMKKFVAGTKGSFEERILNLNEIFSREIINNIMKRNDPGSEDLALQLVRNRLGDFPDDPINAVLYLDTKDSLPGDMLNKVDWMSMKNSLEVRIPFLDHRVVEFAFQIPGQMKLHRGVTKYLLKETFKEFLPKSLYRRPKAGFEVPISRWLKSDLKFLIDEYLNKDRIGKQNIFNYQVIKSLTDAHINNRTDTSWMIWNLIMFQTWYDRFF